VTVQKLRLRKHQGASPRGKRRGHDQKLTVPREERVNLGEDAVVREDGQTEEFRRLAWNEGKTQMDWWGGEARLDIKKGRHHYSDVLWADSAFLRRSVEGKGGARVDRKKWGDSITSPGEAKDLGTV